LVRPISFFEFYLAQFMGYKSLVASTSLLFPVVTCWSFGLPFHPERLPLTLGLLVAFLLLTHTLSFTVASLAFFMNRAQSLTAIKNMAIWVLAGEMIPLDLYPEPLRGWLIWSPFSAGVYIPVGYLTGRIDTAQVQQSLISIAIWGAVAGLGSSMLWRRGVRSYTGTGA
jgi:ABC-2 type transport system permease protein